MRRPLAALERTRRRCKVLTLPHLPCRTAFAIRACSRHTSRWTRHQSMDAHLRFEGAPALWAVFRLPSSSRFSKLSRDGAPVGRRLPFGPGTESRIRPVTGRPSLLPTSFPAPPRASLAVCLPGSEGCDRRNDSGLFRGREDRTSSGPERSWPLRSVERSGRKDRATLVGRGFGVSTFRSRSTCEIRCLLSTGWLIDREGLPFSAPTYHLHLLVQASQLLWLVRTMTVGSQIHICSPILAL